MKVSKTGERVIERGAAAILSCCSFGERFPATPDKVSNVVLRKDERMEARRDSN